MLRQFHKHLGDKKTLKNKGYGNTSHWFTDESYKSTYINRLTKNFETRHQDETENFNFTTNFFQKAEPKKKNHLLE